MASFRFLNLGIGIFNICFVLVIILHLLNKSPTYLLSTVNEAPSYLSKLVVFYNRIPKTGSTTFVNAVSYDLSSANGFHVIYINFTKSKRQFSNKIDQILLARNITSWNEAKPAFYHGHTAFIDFTAFALPNPIYINIVREPIERFISYYYFLRYGDDYRVGLKRKRAGNNETFDECFERRGKDCDPVNLWLQIPYFCGTARFCGDPGNKMALEMAKWNFVNHYFLVGLTERIADMISILENLLPSFFRNASNHFRSLNENRTHLRRTLKKYPLSDKVLKTLRESKIYQMEREFYDFAASEFESVWERVRDVNGKFLTNNFFYDKIRPPIK